MNKIIIIVLLSATLSGCATTSTSEMQGVLLNNKTKDVIVFPNKEDMTDNVNWIPLTDRSLAENLVENSGQFNLLLNKWTHLKEWIERNNK